MSKSIDLRIWFLLTVLEGRNLRSSKGMEYFGIDEGGWIEHKTNTIEKNRVCTRVIEIL
jgi:hypothetical protein